MNHVLPFAAARCARTARALVLADRDVYREFACPVHAARLLLCVRFAKNKKDALHRAAASGDARVVDLLASKYSADVPVWKACALCEAAENGHVAVVELLAGKHGADVHALNECPLRWAAENGHVAVVELLAGKYPLAVHDDDWAMLLHLRRVLGVWDEEPVYPPPDMAPEFTDQVLALHMFVTRYARARTRTCQWCEEAGSTRTWTRRSPGR